MHWKLQSGLATYAEVTFRTRRVNAISQIVNTTLENLFKSAIKRMLLYTPCNMCVHNTATVFGTDMPPLNKPNIARFSCSVKTDRCFLGYAPEVQLSHCLLGAMQYEIYCQVYE
jgi:hypothetical protein